VAVDRFVSCALYPHQQGTIEFHSLDLGDSFLLDLDSLDILRTDRDAFAELTGGNRSRWRRYAAGVVLEMDEAGMPLLPGIAVITGNVPLGSGLSSSAALEASVYVACGRDSEATVDAALLCQRAENRWAEVPCGIMDQYTSLLAEAGRAMLLDCRHLTCRHLPLPDGCAITVIDSGVQRELADGEYRRRRLEIESALEILRKVVGPIESLRDLPADDLAEVEDLLPQPLLKRVLHVVGAMERVQKGAVSLTLGEKEKFGELMVESHRSLAELYEVSIAELDLIVESAISSDGVYGARLTGAGFGGSCVVFHMEGCQKELRSAVAEAFRARLWKEPVFHHLSSVQGARLLGAEDLSGSENRGYTEL
jgi:galactokinase